MLAFFLLLLTRNSLSIGVSGLVMTYAINTLSWFQWLIRLGTEFEVNMNSIERVVFYADGIEQEQSLLHDSASTLTQDWPAQGSISFSNVTLHYATTLEPALKAVSFSVNAGDKVGIVGRTGAGKSSIFRALFRLTEVDHGFIAVDGCDIAKIPLATLRSRLTIIPQDPVLFSGTVRSNLDPFGEFRDQEIWQALRDVHLHSKVSTLPGKLNHSVGDSGAGFSVGECQLLCFARALLMKPKILLMDEATSSVDLITDSLIQQTIKESFCECTVITIAHRLETIMDSDKILVLDHGTVKEYDTPANLLSTSNSLFLSMVMEARKKTSDSS